MLSEFAAPMKTFHQSLETGELFTDEDDKKRILALPELQREKILHERFKKIKDSQLSSVIKELDRQEAPREMKKMPKFEDCDFILPRELIQENIFKPFIDVIKGCFIRIAINKRYRICKILALRKIEPYKLMTKTPQMCTVGFDVDSGEKLVNGLQANFISSALVSIEEFEEFVTGFSIRSFDDMKRKYRKVKQELSRNLTDTELARTIENRLKDNPKKQTNTEKKIEIITKRDEAMQNKDKEKAMQYQKMLEKIEDGEREERKKKMQEDNEKRKKRALL